MAGVWFAGRKQNVVKLRCRWAGHEGYCKEFHGKEFLFYWKCNGSY